MFERFTEQARDVVAHAEEEARGLRHNYIGTEHLLLGLLRVKEGCAARVLDCLDVTIEEVRAQVRRVVGEGSEVTTGQIAFTPRATKALELALREALSLGHNYVGTEHILLGLVRENDGVAAGILLDFDADPETIRAEVVRLLQGVSHDASAHAEGGDDETQILVDLAGLESWSGTVRRSSALDGLALGLALFALAFGLGLLAGRRTRG